MITVRFMSLMKVFQLKKLLNRKFKIKIKAYIIKILVHQGFLPLLNKIDHKFPGLKEKKYLA